MKKKKGVRHRWPTKSQDWFFFHPFLILSVIKHLLLNRCRDVFFISPLLLSATRAATRAVDRQEHAGKQANYAVPSGGRMEGDQRKGEGLPGGRAALAQLPRVTTCRRVWDERRWISNGTEWVIQPVTHWSPEWRILHYLHLRTWGRDGGGGQGIVTRKVDSTRSDSGESSWGIS